MVAGAHSSPRPAVTRQPFPFAWSAAFGLGFPLNGVSLGRTIAHRWRIRAGVGNAYPFPVLALGGSVGLARGFAIGRIATVAPGATVDGFVTRFCSAGGCGPRHRYLGVGPTVSLHFHIPAVRRVWLGIGAGGGVTIAFARERMRWVQPHVQALNLTLGWPHRPG